MSDDHNGKSGGWFGNPLPIVMMVLLAGGLLVKNVPLESARPTDPERIQFVPTGQQNVEARLWQDPFAAVEKHEKSFNHAIAHPETASDASHTPEALRAQIQARHKKPDDVTVVAVSVFGGPYAEDAESRRRSRFAVISALDFPDDFGYSYHPESNDAIGYFDLPKSESNADKMTVPYEWFEDHEKSLHVLVLWLKEDQLTAEPLTKLQHLFNQLTKDASPNHSSNVKLIGPAGSAMLTALISDMKKTPKPISATGKEGGGTLQVFAPGATISNCDLLNVDSVQPWDCFMTFPDRLNNEKFPIVRTTGTDDVIATALLWELWQRGINRELGYVGSWWTRMFEKGTDARKCDDGLVLIGERDTQYGRTLLRYLNDGFSARCGIAAPVRIFNYLRGLDGVLPGTDKSVGKAPPKNESGKSKDLREQLDDAPPEQAEGRNQLDYLRRLADEIDRLDRDKKSFAENGVKAIGIVGSDLYDKLIILQALRSRFKDKIFFTTDLDARYLHADQNDWARNLVVASNFSLSLNPKLMSHTLPFRDSYQTATYLATLMALKDSPPDWTGKMKKWLEPQIFEIGRTEAVHLASPSVKRLTCWMAAEYSEDSPKYSECMKKGEKPENSNGNEHSEDSDSPATNKPCTSGWWTCANIEPIWPSRGLSLDHTWGISFMVFFGLLWFSLANRHVNEMLRTACGTPSPERKRAWAMIGLVIAAIAVVSIVLWIVWNLINDSLSRGVGEPFMWFEGISVWPSLVIRSVGLLTILGLWYAFLKMIQRKETRISEDFDLPLLQPQKLTRRWWSPALNSPHLNLALFDTEGHADACSAVKEETTGKKIIDVMTLWKNYLRATSIREMAGWIATSMVIASVLVIVPFLVLDKPSFPHRGDLVWWLYTLLVTLNALVLGTVIFWVGYETRVCARFIETLSGPWSLWPPVLLDREEASTGVPLAHLDDYLDFKLIVHATQRIRWLIYLPFVGILFMVVSRSNFFDAMDFPLSLVFVVGLALVYALHSAWLLRRSAESARSKAIEYYERQLLIQARVKDSQPPILIVDPISVEQIKLLLERIRNNHEGAFAPFAQQPALQALLLPFGGYGSIQIIEYLFKL